MEPILSSEQNITPMEAPEQMERAGFSDRFFAAFVDNIMLNIPLRMMDWLLFVPIINSQTELIKVFGYSSLSSLIHLVVVLGYFAGYAYSKKGQTLGKEWNKVRVVDLHGNDLSLSHFMLREILARGIPIIGVWFIGSTVYIWYLTYLLALNENKRALHDIIAKTQVIKVK